MKKSKKLIYLISPVKLENNFYSELIKLFQTRKIRFFQLRLKNIEEKKLVAIGNKIKSICKRFNIKLIINDFPKVAKIVNADGCHLGQNDYDLNKARKLLKNKIIGITCHNSKKLALRAVRDGADYIALGSFYKSKTKKTSYRAKTHLIEKLKKEIKVPIVVIGGINNKNYKKLLLNKADFLAMSSYIWNNNKFNPVEAIKELKI